MTIARCSFSARILILRKSIRNSYTMLLTPVAPPIAVLLGKIQCEISV